MFAKAEPAPPILRQQALLFLCIMHPARIPKQVLSLRLQRTVKIRGRRSTINEKVRPCNEGSFAAHQQLCHIGHLVRRTGTSRRTPGKHIFVEIPARAVKLIDRQWRNNNSRRDGIDSSALFTPFYRLGHNTLFIAPFGQLIRVERIPDILRLKQW